MLYILAPRPPKTNLPVMLNIQYPVGVSSPNNAEDVLYVKFLLRNYATASPAMPAAKRQKMMGLTMDGTCDTVTREAIVDYQQMRGEQHSTFNPAGRISPASSTAANWDSSQSIISLTYAAKNVCGDKWPLLGTMANCPPALVAAVKRALCG